MPKFLCLLALIACLLSVGCSALTTLHVSDLKQNKAELIGSSGLPLGTIFFARGDFEVKQRIGKSGLSPQRLRVSHINGLPVAEPYFINIDTRYYNINLNPAKDITLIGFESGTFIGQPPGLIEHTYFIPGDIGFGFIERFVVIREAHTGDSVE
ncbi:MAG: hypothetical protein AAGB26_10000 [Planctomycetota bacterium]